MKNTLFLLISFLLLLTACKSTKQSSSNSLSPKLSSKKLNNLINKNAFDYKYFSTKARVIFNKQTFTANFRMKKDDLIWISFTGPFNIEGARVLISKDRFQMINKLNKTYYDMPLSYIENYIPINADLALLQDLIVGNVLEKNLQKQKTIVQDKQYILEGKIATLNTRYNLNQNARPVKIDITAADASKKVNIVFEKYEKVDNQDFALKRKYLIQDEQKNYVLDLKFYKHQFSTVAFPFEVPSGYTTYK